MNSAVSPALRLLPPEVNASEFEALTHLLDDPDALVSSTVRTKLLSYGVMIAPALRALYEQTMLEMLPNIPTQELLLAVLHEHQSRAMKGLVEMIKSAAERGGDIELERAVVSLSQFGYPETDAALVQERLDGLALRTHALFVKSQKHNELSLLLSINQAFFEEYGFCATPDEDYYSPDNSYVHAMLESKRGIPISLSALYLLVAERAGVTLHGIGMPSHFLVYHPVLDVYINTFKNGAFLTENDCKKFVQDSGLLFDPSMLSPVSNLAILLRMIRNLIFAYNRIAYSRPHAEWEVTALQEVSDAIIESMNQ
jgi:regulator of sirC expression with transglutaminase-like and TPR domain